MWGLVMAGHIADAESPDWNTPVDLLIGVRAVIGGQIGLDPCSNPTSKVDAKVSYQLPVNGLTTPWTAESVFVNPPFGRVYLHRVTHQCIGQKDYARLLSPYKNDYIASSVKHWVKRCEWTAVRGAEVFLLCPAAVGTTHWQNLIFKSAKAICFFKGRLSFDRPSGDLGPAPMDCALVYWGPNVTKFKDEFESYGKVILS